MQFFVDQVEADGESRGKLGAVGHDDENRTLVALQFEEERRHRVGRSAIEIARRLVAQQEPWPPDECPCERHALFFTPRELARQVCHPVREPDLFDQPARVRVAVWLRLPHKRRHEYVLEHAALRQQTVILENEADFFVAERGEIFRRQRERVRPVQRDGSRRRWFERTENI